MFVVFEGIDGCGKTTAASYIARCAEECGVKTTLTREPGGWDGGEWLREAILERDWASHLGRFFMFAADRAEHAARVIGPALARGELVICDRYTPSTIAYQISGSRDLAPDAAEAAADMLYQVGFPEPDAVVWLDCSVETARARAESRGRLSVFELMGDAFYSRVRGGYARMASRDPDRWITIDADRDEVSVREAVYHGLDMRLDIFPEER